MSSTPTTQAQNRWQQQPGADFLQFIGEGGGISGWVDSSGIGQGNLGSVISSVTTLSSSQILSLNTTPVQLVSAPGANQLIVPVVCTAQLKFNTTAYASGGLLSVYYSARGPALSDLANFAAALVTSTSSEIDPFGVSNARANGNQNMLLQTAGVNQPILIKANVGNFTTGDGILLISLGYQIVTLN